MESSQTSEDEEQITKKYRPVMKFSYLKPNKGSVKSTSKKRASYSSDEYSSLSRQNSEDNHYYTIESAQDWIPNGSDTYEEERIYENVPPVIFRRRASSQYVNTPPKKNALPHIKGLKTNNKPIMFSERTYEEREEEQRLSSELGRYHSNGVQNQLRYAHSEDVTRYTPPIGNVKPRKKDVHQNNSQKVTSFPKEPIVKNISSEDYKKKYVTKIYIDDNKKDSYISYSSQSVNDNLSRRGNIPPSPAKRTRHTSPSPAARQRHFSPTRQKQRISPVEFSSRRSRFEKHNDFQKCYITGSYIEDSSAERKNENLRTNKQDEINTGRSKSVSSPFYTNQVTSSNVTTTKRSAFSPVLTNGSLGRTVRMDEMEITTSSSGMKTPTLYKSQEELVKMANQQYRQYLNKQEKKISHSGNISTNNSSSKEQKNWTSSLPRNLSPPVTSVTSTKRSSSMDEQENIRFGRSVSSLVKRYETVEEDETNQWNNYKENYYGMKRARTLPRLIHLDQQNQNNVVSESHMKVNMNSTIDESKQNSQIKCDTTNRLEAFSPMSILSSPGYLSPPCIQSMGNGTKCINHKHSSSLIRSENQNQTNNAAISDRKSVTSPNEGYYKASRSKSPMFDNFYGEEKNTMNRERRVLTENYSYQTAVSPSISPPPRFESLFPSKTETKTKSYGSSMTLDKSSVRKSDLNTKRFSAINRRSQSSEPRGASRTVNHSYTTDYVRPKTRIATSPLPEHFSRMTNDAMKKTQSYQVNSDQRILDILFRGGEDNYFDSQIKQKQEVIGRSKYIQEKSKMASAKSYGSESGRSVISENTSIRNSPAPFRSSAKQVENSSFTSVKVGSQHRDITSPVNMIGSVKSTQVNLTDRKFLTSPIPYGEPNSNYRPGCEVISQSASTTTTNHVDLTNKKSESIIKSTSGTTTWDRSESPCTYVARTYYVANSQLPNTSQVNEVHEKMDQQISDEMSKRKSFYREFSCTGMQNGLKRVNGNSNSLERGQNSITLQNSQQTTKRYESVKSPSNYSNSCYSPCNSGNSVINVQTLSNQTSKKSGASVLKFVVDSRHIMNDIEDRRSRYLKSIEQDNHFPTRSDIITPPPSYYSAHQKEI